MLSRDAALCYDYLGSAKTGEILLRVTGERQEIGSLAGVHGADLVVDAEKASAFDRGHLEYGNGRKTGSHVRRKLVMYGRGWEIVSRIGIRPDRVQRTEAALWHSAGRCPAPLGNRGVLTKP